MADAFNLYRRSLLQGIAATAAATTLGIRPSPAAETAAGVTDTEVVIGAIGQLTGPFAFIGAPARDGMRLAIDKINEAGRINGRQLKLNFEHAATPAESVAAAKKLVESDKVFVLVIASGSTGAAAAADYVRSVGIPSYNMFGATPIIREPFARNVFHGSIPDASVSGEGMIQQVFRAAPQAKKIGILAGTYSFPQSTLKAIEPALRKRPGVEIVIEQFDAAARDYTSQLVSFVRQRVDAIMILGSFSEAGFAIKQGPEKGISNIPWILDGSGSNDGIVPIIGAENSKNVWGYFNAPYFPSQTDAPMAGFNRLWIEKYGQPPQARPNLYDIIAYGCTYNLAQVIKQAGSNLTWDTLISAWERLNDAKPSGMGGYDVVFPETVTPTDHQGNKLVGPARIVNGKWMVVW